MKWFAFFSQTGSEIVNISEQLGRKPELIVTNNTSETKYKFHPKLRTLKTTIMSGDHDILMNYFEKQTLYPVSEVLITLHGYLRIIPPKVCNLYEMYNGHPGAISLYPELKGKDPQIRVWQNRNEYDIIGSVVHRVVPEVDDGTIEIEDYIQNTATSEEEVFELLKITSLDSWVQFLQRKLT